MFQCSADMILELMKELSVMEEKSIPLISKSKILVISHDISFHGGINLQNFFLVCVQDMSLHSIVTFPALCLSD